MFKLKHIFQDEGMWWGDSSGGGGYTPKTTGHKQTFWTKGKPHFKTYKETRQKLVQNKAKLNAKTEM